MLPILAALAGGWLAGRYLLSGMVNKGLVRLIGPLVWLMLFLIGVEFENALRSLDAVRQVMGAALLMVVTTTAVPCLLLTMFFRPARSQVPIRRTLPSRKGLRARGAAMLPALRECGLAILMVSAGLVASAAMAPSGISASPLGIPLSHVALMVLIVLVGVDLAGLDIKRHWFSRQVLSVPIIVVAGSLLGAVVVHLVTGDDLRLLLALATGFGWFTLSSTLVGSLAGEIYGATALFVDLGREFVAIVLLYLLGRRHARLGIAAAGATAMDSTLPIVRQTCRPEEVPMAFVSGFLLTLLAPFLITAFLAR